MNGTLITSTPKSSMHALACQGIMVASCYPQLRDMLRKKLGDLKQIRGSSRQIFIVSVVIGVSTVFYKKTRFYLKRQDFYYMFYV